MEETIKIKAEKEMISQCWGKHGGIKHQELVFDNVE